MECSVFSKNLRFQKETGGFLQKTKVAVSYLQPLYYRNRPEKKNRSPTKTAKTQQGCVSVKWFET